MKFKEFLDLYEGRDPQKQMWTILLHPEDGAKGAKPYPKAQVDKLVKHLGRKGSVNVLQNDAKGLKIHVSFNDSCTEDGVWDMIQDADLDDSLSWGGSVRGAKKLAEAGKVHTIRKAEHKPRGAPEEKARAFFKKSHNHSLLKKLAKEKGNAYHAMEFSDEGDFVMVLMMKAGDVEKAYSDGSDYYGVNVLFYPGGKVDASYADDRSEQQWKKDRAGIIMAAKKALKDKNLPDIYDGLDGVETKRGNRKLSVDIPEEVGPFVRKRVLEAGKVHTIKNPKHTPRGAPEGDARARAFDPPGYKRHGRVPGKGDYKVHGYYDGDDYIGVLVERDDIIDHDYHGITVLFMRDGKIDADTYDKQSKMQWLKDKELIVRIAKAALKNPKTYRLDADYGWVSDEDSYMLGQNKLPFKVDKHELRNDPKMSRHHSDEEGNPRITKRS